MPLSVATTGTQISVNASRLAGGNSTRVRVMATDGVNTSEDVSDAPFTVESKGPQAFIFSPGEGANAPVGVPLYLQGSAYDLEDGTLDETALQWSSDQDGNLGVGSLVKANLSQGQHIITLAATDNDSNLGTATINVSVGSNKTYLPVILK